MPKSYPPLQKGLIKARNLPSIAPFPNDRPDAEKESNEINPDVLGYIFEKYINQKQFGAYYTRPQITEYLCDRTINKLILDRVNRHANQEFTDIKQLLGSLNDSLCHLLLEDILPELSLLDPACGSGAFLVAAMKTLIPIYQQIIHRVAQSSDERLSAWLQQIQQSHNSLEYYIKKRIITDNLYGVDIMEEATEIAKLRLFLALVASVDRVEDLEPLPNVDFNIMAGNSLIGLIRVDGDAFNRLHSSSSAIQGDLLAPLAASEYQKILAEKNKSIELYKKHAFLSDEQRHPEERSKDQSILALRDHIDGMNRESQVKLNQILLDEFSTKLGIKYEQAQLQGKPKKRLLNRGDMDALEPFHWGYHFDKVFARGGFDAIIANPPWEIFKPQAKEFFARYSDLVTKNKMDIKTFEKEQKKLLQNPEVAAAWCEYKSQFPHVSLYYRSAEKYQNQISVVNGRKQGTDINLYKLFLERCFHLLRSGGECGIVIPSGIYTDLGTKQLRELLFSQTQVTGLFCFENRKAIFEGVDSRFKFVVLSFEKGGKTESFPTRFMRHEVGELLDFPGSDDIYLDVDLIRRLSPDSLSVMEFKSEMDVQIAQKMTRFPLLGETVAGKWNLKLTREFDMTNDSHLFKTEPGEGRLPLYEGKMIHQFTHLWGEPKYWLDEQEAKDALLSKRLKSIQKECRKCDLEEPRIEDILLDYNSYRIAFRDVAASTNERTAISTILTPNVFCPHTMSLEQVYTCQFLGNEFNFNTSSLNNKYRLFICTLMNSFIFDCWIRRSITAHVSFFFVYNTPVPRLQEGDRWFHPIVDRAAKLICTTPEFDDLAAEVGLGSHHHGVTDETERSQLRAELDGIIAHLYNLTATEFAHILTTFPIVPDAVKQAALNAYRDLD
ncbi:hypothetical protein PJF56_22090 [Roseofilum sp. BLCC_M91]|uniref:site-specific DNA-methyltransferase (adenine-specific) n=1 Tax=Roseofilum halophilum BLCC-M91 TaxID=3022259 RepID=A0ABT7BQT3_9CYAN|nr:DNA methyltransferase [Roseofilum halophilum]MDJ1181561.1 hypothetical protein [Roseofilum halophilum BLCC-M91]